MRPRFDQAEFDRRRADPEFQRMVEASMDALDLPGGEQLLQDALDHKITVPEMLAGLLVLSGEYVPRDA